MYGRDRSHPVVHTTKFSYLGDTAPMLDTTWHHVGTLPRAIAAQ